MIITLAAQKGGVGKTTLALNLAMSFASFAEKEGKRVALVDADFQASCMKLMANHQKKNLDIVAAPKDPHKIIQKMSDHMAVFVDTPADLDAATYQACAVSDVILVPIQPSPIDILATAPTIEALEKIKAKFDLSYECRFVINRVAGGTVLARQIREYIEKSFPYPVMKTALHDRQIYKQSLIEGKSVVDYDKNSAATKEIADLILELNTIIKTK